MALRITRRMGVAAAAVGAVAAGGVAVALLAGGPASAGDYAFEIVTVERGDVARIVSASGQVRALNTVEVGSEVSGKIVELLVDYNSTVRADEVIARIDPESFATAVRQAQANLLQAEASVANARAAIERSQVSLDVIAKAYERQKNLLAEGAISTAAWEQAERDYKFAEVDLATNRTQLQSALAALEQRKAALEEAELKLARTVIRSPIDGVVIERAINIGQTVQASMQAPKFFVIAQDLSDIRIDANVVESDIGGIDAGDPVAFTVDTFPGQRFQGVVEQVRLQGREQANVVTYTVVVAARNPGAQLLPGMTANVEITADRATGVLRIAEDATRFSPPREIQERLAAADGAGGPGGGPAGRGQAGFPGGLPGGGRGGNPIEEQLVELGIDADRIARISGELRAEFQRNMPQQAAAQGGPLGGGGFGPPQQFLQQQQMQEMRTRMETAREAIMRRELTAEEYEAYSKLRGEQMLQKRAPMYVVGPDGELERRMVIVGLSDGDFVEIVRGAGEGDAFVVRARAAGGE
jgi:HlyD family secretion protein